MNYQVVQTFGYFGYNNTTQGSKIVWVKEGQTLDNKFLERHPDIVNKGYVTVGQEY